jgi:hypothetical protein
MSHGRTRGRGIVLIEVEPHRQRCAPNRPNIARSPGAVWSGQRARHAMHADRPQHRGQRPASSNPLMPLASLHDTTWIYGSFVGHLLGLLSLACQHRHLCRGGFDSLQRPARTATSWVIIAHQVERTSPPTCLGAARFRPRLAAADALWRRGPTSLLLSPPVLPGHPPATVFGMK